MELILGDFQKSPSASGRMSLLGCFARAAERGGKGLYGIEAEVGKNRRGKPRG